MIAVIISAVLGTVVSLSCIVAIVVNEHRYDWVDRVCVGGLAGSMLLTTPALFVATPFDAWSFNLSRLFLAGMCAKRFLRPLVVQWRGERRQRAQIDASRLKLHDRREDWL